MASFSVSYQIVLVLVRLGLVASTIQKALKLLGLEIKPNRCGMLDGLLEELVFLKCNE